MSHIDEEKSSLGGERSLGWEEPGISKFVLSKRQLSWQDNSKTERTKHLTHLWTHSCNNQLLQVYLIPDPILEDDGSDLHKNPAFMQLTF